MLQMLTNSCSEMTSSIFHTMWHLLHLFLHLTSLPTFNIPTSLPTFNTSLPTFNIGRWCSFTITDWFKRDVKTKMALLSLDIVIQFCGHWLSGFSS